MIEKCYLLIFQSDFGEPDVSEVYLNKERAEFERDGRQNKNFDWHIKECDFIKD